ncbi:MAG: undecaprenyl-diphosphate phosphatase [Firmicutes bacterium]|nr:undecaprenyl-diphosphate phosphatase [Bacillota bacterium]MCL1953323.1 undecaprenyl-diphosphate phosphatase [Bacillota bacterium]
MDIFQAFILGIVQGLTEFLPVSSSGHLLLVRDIMGITGDYIFFDLMLHVGSLLAILITMYNPIVKLFKPPFGQAILIAIASIPAIILGFCMRSTISTVFGDAKYLTFFFMFTAIMLLVCQWLSNKIGDKGKQEVDIKTAVCMGLAQGVAIFPGISRSGSTITGGIARGANRQAVAIFSFLMSIPIILGGALVEAMGDGVLDNIAISQIIVGGMSSFASGFLAIKVMLKLIAKADFKWFSLYLAILSIICFFVYFL